MITQQEYQARRAAIFSKMEDNSIALLNAAKSHHRNNDTEYPFRQDSYFHYVTGFNETPAVAVLLKKAGICRFILFCEGSDPTVTIWTGPRAGLEDAKEEYGADEAHLIKDIDVRLKEVLAGLSCIYYLLGATPCFDNQAMAWLTELRKKSRQGIAFPQQIRDLRELLDEMRLVKTSTEIAILRKVAEISAKGHIRAMEMARPGMFEYSLEGVLLNEFCSQGARELAYPCIVAAGNNGCILHYTRNNAPLKAGELVLIDAGAELANYAADITRTFPVNGKFSSEQQAIYECVLAAQMAAIELIKPGLEWDKIQACILEILVRGLVELKILKGNVADLIAEKAYLPFYMHNSGHWLGIDVHDVGNYKLADQWRPLIAGMVLTVEPGLYLSATHSAVPEKYRGIAVRIEDDILVTSTGYEVLSAAAPKSVVDIQKLMSAKG